MSLMKYRFKADEENYFLWQKSETFVDYFQKEKRKFNIGLSISQKIHTIIISLVFGFLGLDLVVFGIELIIDVCIGEYVNPEVFQDAHSKLSTD